MSSEFRETNYTIPSVCIDDMEEIPSMVTNGLRVLCLCRGGQARSWALADCFNDLGINARFVEGGLNSISDSLEKNQDRFAELLSCIPDIIVFLPQDEIKKFREQIEKINSKRSKRVIFTTSSNMSPLVAQLSK